MPKRKSTHPDENPSTSKRARDFEAEDEPGISPRNNESTAGKIIKVFMRNFMCHDAMEINLNKNVNFIVGRNGSGKSAILTALTVGLGAKANETNRAKSMKEFIKKGKTNATIEITLNNQGGNAYNPEIFGDSISVCRSIGSSTTYRIKNDRGQTLFTKRSDLESILNHFNIQVDNPICILNQDVSRSFLMVSDASKKYQLFMKATQLDIIFQKYRDSQLSTDDAQKRLKEAQEYLVETDAEITELTRKMEILDAVQNLREEYEELKIKKIWAGVISQERILTNLRAALEKSRETVKELLTREETKDSKQKEYDAKIREIQDKIAAERSGNAEKKVAYEISKKEFDVLKQKYLEKSKAVNILQTSIQTNKDEILQIQEEVNRLEKGRSNVEKERKEKQESCAKLKTNLNDIEAIIQTKQVDKRHLENDKMCIDQEKHTLKSKLDKSRYTHNQINSQLLAIQKQSNHAISIYGPNMPRLLKRIDEEYAKGNFRQKPRGPLGAYIKVKDESWIPAVENFLGGMIRSFCTDNKQDTKLLSLIMREVFHGERAPQIISSAFLDRVHDTSRKGCFSPQFSNMLQAMDISDPVVANCIIDQREIECILLIPSNKEACDNLSQRETVPRNCKRAITKSGDTYFPDPHYRTYGGKRGLRARFLQVSTDQAIQALKEELVAAQSEMQKAEQQYNAVIERVRFNDTECQNVSRTIYENVARQRNLKEQIEKLEDELNSNEVNELSVLTNDLQDHKLKLKEDEETDTVLKNEMETMKGDLEKKNIEWKKARDEVQNFQTKIFPFEQQIRTLQTEKEELNLSARKSTETLRKAKGVVQKAEADFETHQRVVTKAIADAENRGPRMKVAESEKDLEIKVATTMRKIQESERACGSRQEIETKLAEKNEQYQKIAESVQRLEENITKQMERLILRKKKYASLRNQIGQKVQHAFENILSLRKYKGTIYIDHKHLTLDLEVSPANDSQRKTNDAKTLSGGERSYSTVAFILALWDCTGLPFYFLDEFDVFMDKVNRRVIMDILLEHTRLYPHKQFGFLTPLDTSHITSDDYVSIHQLAPPEREAESQDQ